MQRGEFLKGKFALLCQNYSDALYYFIRIVKKESIVINGLIKKKALKRIFKVFTALSKNLKNYNLMDLIMEDEFMIYENMKNGNIYNKLKKKVSLRIDINNYNTFQNELENINNCLTEDSKEYNKKRKNKDIIIIVDFNIYDLNEKENIKESKYLINSFIVKTKTILNTYLSDNDRLGVFIYRDKYQIICPLMNKKEIDVDSFSNDLINDKNKNFHRS